MSNILFTVNKINNFGDNTIPSMFLDFLMLETEKIVYYFNLL